MHLNLQGRARRQRRIRKKVSGTTERPRLNVFRSARHIYAQVIDDTTGMTLASSSSKAKDFSNDGDKVAAAKAVGALIAQACVAKGIEQVVFDRGGYLFHGRVKALAEAAREGGLKF
ncbi:MAG: 50S ribosomal protein L18 [Myxococcales bacterium]|nr:50S ribosomal protein L18 [Myxococcales bacterium]